MILLGISVLAFVGFVIWTRATRRRAERRVARERLYRMSEDWRRSER